MARKTMYQDDPGQLPRLGKIPTLRLEDAGQHQRIEDREGPILDPRPKPNQHAADKNLPTTTKDVISGFLKKTRIRKRGAYFLGDIKNVNSRELRNRFVGGMGQKPHPSANICASTRFPGTGCL